MKIVTIIGARPQFIKAAMVSRAISAFNRKYGNRIKELILHTGQHYDANMSDIFFEEMQMPRPFRQLQCGNGSHAVMTAQMLVKMEKILLETRPDYVLVYGDTNSTLAGAVAAAKIQIPVVHVEAGLRSFNKRMPEEINRIITDHISHLLFCPTSKAVENLRREGFTKGVYHVGDVMQDAALSFSEIAEKSSDVLSRLALESKQFYLSTLHRAENTDHKERLTQIIDAFLAIASPARPVILPLHPRTRQYLDTYQLYRRIEQNPALRLTDPLSFLDMVKMEKHALAIFTDSGGVQKEAYFHRTPCITLREETEWVETVEAGWNQLAGYRTEKILQCLQNQPERLPIDEYGKGDAADLIIQKLYEESTYSL